MGKATEDSIPGEMGYPIKQFKEKIDRLSALNQDAKIKTGFNQAAQRVYEADKVDDRIATETANKQIADAQTIEKLVDNFSRTFNSQADFFGQMIDSGIKPPSDKAKWAEAGMVNIYSHLINLRLGAPPEAQSSILQAINTIQTTLATVQDALGQAPVSEADGQQLAKLVSQGFLTREELTRIISSATSNRQLVDSVRNLVKSGQIPTSTLYSIDYDVIKQLAAKEIDHIVAAVDFDEMRKVAIFSKTIVPTPNQKQALQAYLANYNFGQQLPRDASRSFIMPVVYGLNLTPNMPKALKNLDETKLSPVRQLLYQAWQPLTAAEGTADAKKLYSQILDLTDISLARNVDLLERVELELLKALRANVAYMALPPGWTDAQVAAAADDFAQSIKDLKASNAVQAKSQAAVDSLASITAPMVVPLQQPQIDQIRLAILPQLATIQQQMIKTGVSATDPAAVAPDLTNQVSSLQQQFDQLVAELGAKPPAAADDDLTALKNQLKAALAEVSDAKTAVQDFVKANVALAANLKDSISSLATDQKNTAAKLQVQLDFLAAAGAAPADIASLKDRLQDVQTASSQNLTSLQDQLTAAGQTSASAQAKLELNLISQSNQIAQLEAKLNLSEVARAALKEEVSGLVTELKAAQAQDIKDLNDKINTNSALQSQLNDVTKKQVSDLSSAQSQLLDQLQAQVNDKQLLKDQLEASITDLRASQNTTHALVENLAASGTSLSDRLKVIKTETDQALQQVKDNIAAETTARVQLQETIDDLKSAQTLAAKQLDEGLLALGTQLRQAISEVGAAQKQTDLAIASLGSSLVETQNAVVSLQTTQVSLQTQLQAQASANADLRQELEQSVATLSQAQVATQTQLNALKTDVAGLKSSLTAIAAIQVEANTRIDQLLAASVNWTSLPSSLQFNQNQFEQYQQQLADDFAAKAAALQAQFESYKKELDSSIQTLRGDVNSQIQQLKQEQAELKAQLEAAQQLLNQTTTPTTNTSTPTSTSGPTTTTVPGL